VVNDDVMGGVSKGEFSINKNGVLKFSGKVSLDNNGGFASIRSRPGQYDLSQFAGLLIRVRGEGQRYACNLRTDYDIMAGSYQCKFDTKKDTWQKVFLPFADFVPTSFGQVMRDAPRLNASDIRSLGFMISDKQAGPFRLEIDWVKAIRHHSAGQHREDAGTLPQPGTLPRHLENGQLLAGSQVLGGNGSAVVEHRSPEKKQPRWRSPSRRLGSGYLRRHDGAASLNWRGV
jgi:NADH dehydrogenase [ubiquinone] 1 alpha subcomplex assembly factor 1